MPSYEYYGNIPQTTGSDADDRSTMSRTTSEDAADDDDLRTRASQTTTTTTTNKFVAVVQSQLFSRTPREQLSLPLEARRCTSRVPGAK